MGAPVFEGGCLCGSTRFRVTAEAKNRCYCHCRSCRLAAGAPFVAWATFPASGFQVIAGELREYRSSEKVIRCFCATCGTAISYRHEDRPGELDVATATLDDSASVAPECHIWVSEKLPWVFPVDRLPRFARWPEADEPEGGTA